MAQLSISKETFLLSTYARFHQLIFKTRKKMKSKLKIKVNLRWWTGINDLHIHFFTSIPLCFCYLDSIRQGNIL